MHHCANAYGVKQAVKEEGVPLLKENRGHPSIRNLIQEGYQV